VKAQVAQSDHPVVIRDNPTIIWAGLEKLFSLEPFAPPPSINYWNPIKPESDMDIITRLEEAILLAIWRLGDDAYGLNINKRVSRFLKKNYSLGALYFSLDQLRRKGLVEKTVKHRYREQGGRSRTYYRLTDRGEAALAAVREYQESLWSGIPRTVFEGENSK
jgi:DNA-binding PadR family transcriptional regulator